MESRPRVMPEKERIDTLDWVSQARWEYHGIDSSEGMSTHTYFSKGEPLISLLDRTLSTVTHTPNILIVGLGLYSPPLLCSYIPQRVGAHLQRKGIDYKMTLVDPSYEVIEDVQSRTTLYLYPHNGSDIDKRYTLSLWNKYLRDTDQEGREITVSEEGLVCNRGDLNPGLGIDENRYLRRGLLAADVSQDFRERLLDGRIQLREEDIARAHLSTSQSFDLVDSTNVLYIIPAAGQQLAIANIAGSMKEGGKLLVDDAKYLRGDRVFPQFGGWLTEEKLGELNLAISERIVEKEGRVEMWILEKT